MTDSSAEARAQPQSPTEPHAQPQPPTQPSEEELRAAYEAELNRITSAEMLLQTAASLLNLGARRLGLTGGGGADRDLEQVRDAIDGVRALMPILERCNAGEVGPLRDALSQLQMAYAREASGPAPEGKTAGETPAGAGAGSGATPGSGEAPGTPAQPAPGGRQPGQSRQPGPAESSGRLWVPGR